MWLRPSIWTQIEFFFLNGMYILGFRIGMVLKTWRVLVDKGTTIEGFED